MRWVDRDSGDTSKCGQLLRDVEMLHLSYISMFQITRDLLGFHRSRCLARSFLRTSTIVPIFILWTVPCWVWRPNTLSTFGALGII